MKYLDDVMKVIREINQRNILLKHKMGDDERFVRIYKRIDEQNKIRKMDEPFIISKIETERVEALNRIREEVEEILYEDRRTIENEAYFGQEVMQRVSNTLQEMNLAAASRREDRIEIRRLIVQEYTSQYQYYKFKAA